MQMKGYPTSDKLKEGDTLHLVLYNTDFEIIIRDNTAYHSTDDFVQSMLFCTLYKE